MSAKDAFNNICYNYLDISVNNSNKLCIRMFRYVQQCYKQIT